MVYINVSGLITTLIGMIALLFAGQAVGQSPTVEEALGRFKPIQPHVDYAIVEATEVPQCTMTAEKGANGAAWVIRNRQGETLRRFADTNGDNIVDQWCYYLNGVEVYRDIDSNFNKSPDEYRWFHTAGMRWGIDKNEDRRIDSWRAISPHEVAEQVVLALKSRDPALFNLVLLTPEELAELGFGKEQAHRIGEKLQTAPTSFSKLVAEQRIVTPQTRYVDFGSTRPGCIPSGTADSTKDVIVLDNATALVETDGKHEQIFLGALVAVGNTWKLINAPAIGNQSQDSGLFDVPLASAQSTSTNTPSEETQKLLAQLEQLDRQANSLPPEKQAENIEQRVNLMQRLAETAPEAEREQWFRQLAGMLSIAIQAGSYPQGIERLTQLQQSLAEAGASEELVAHVVFQKMWAEYVASQGQQSADAAKLQEKWLADLHAFVEKYPKSADSAEALLQLGMYQDFLGKTQDATKWYQQLVTNFPTAEQAAKANGAIRRLNSIGKPIRLRGTDIDGRETIDSLAPPYRGKVVLIHYWATWCEPCKADMVLLKDVMAKRGGRDFQIIGVCLDDTPAAAKQYLMQHKFPWKHVYEAGGLDSRLANELGVMTLPLMLLVDQNGMLAHNNIHVGTELEAELNRLIRPATGTATSPRDTPPRR